MRTTININNDLSQKLKDTSERLEISTHHLIAILLNAAASENNFDIGLFKGVKYQNADPEKRWQKLHVRFEPQVYEKGLDLKKCFKLSVSFIISFAIINFLDVIEAKYNNPNNKMDNYPLNYIFIARNYDGIHGFIVIWGIPEEKHLKNLLP